MFPGLVDLIFGYIVEDFRAHPVWQRTLTDVPESLCNEPPASGHGWGTSLGANLTKARMEIFLESSILKCLNCDRDTDSVFHVSWLAETDLGSERLFGIALRAHYNKNANAADYTHGPQAFHSRIQALKQQWGEYAQLKQLLYSTFT